MISKIYFVQALSALCMPAKRIWAGVRNVIGYLYWGKTWESVSSETWFIRCQYLPPLTRTTLDLSKVWIQILNFDGAIEKPSPRPECFSVGVLTYEICERALLPASDWRPVDHPPRMQMAQPRWYSPNSPVMPDFAGFPGLQTLSALSCWNPRYSESSRVTEKMIVFAFDLSYP